MDRPEDAYASWTISLNEASKRDTRYRKKVLIDYEGYYLAIDNIIQYYFKTKRFEDAKSLLEENKDIFESRQDPEAVGRYYHNLGFCNWQLREYDLSQRFYEKALDQYMISGSKHLIGRVQFSLADGEYHVGNLDRALALLRSAKEYNVTDSLDTQFRTDKDLAKVLIVRGELIEAAEIIENNLSEMQDIQCVDQELKAKFLLMKADITKDSSELLKVNDSWILSDELRIDIARVITKIYLEDNPCMLKYYSVIEENMSVPTYFLGRWF